MKRFSRVIPLLCRLRTRPDRIACRLSVRLFRVRSTPPLERKWIQRRPLLLLRAVTADPLKIREDDLDHGRNRRAPFAFLSKESPAISRTG